MCGTTEDGRAASPAPLMTWVIEPFPSDTVSKGVEVQVAGADAQLPLNVAFS